MMRSDASEARATVATTRRGFLRLAGATSALTALAQLPAGALAAGAGASAGGARAARGPSFFDEAETEILTQILERVVDSGLEEAPRVRDTGAMATVDAFCRRLDPGVSQLLPWLLRAFEYGPFVLDFTFSRFTRMSDAEKDASLEAWATSRIGARRLAFLAVRNLCFVGWYSQEETWPLIGYRGPLLRDAGRGAP